MQYISTFMISCFFVYLGEKQYNKKNKSLAILYFLISVSVGAFLAGARDSSIGSDVLTYGNYVFSTARRSSNPIALFHYYDDIGIEPLYLLFNFCVSRFTSDQHVFYFFLEFLIIILFLFGSLKLDYGGKTWVSMWVFYTLFYGFTLNGMRQSVAIAFVYFGQHYIYKRDFWKFFLVIILATGFHYTAFFFLLLYALNVFIEKNKKNIIIKDILLIVFMTFIAIGFQSIIKIAASFMPKYNRYLGGNEYNFSVNPFIIRIAFLIFFLSFYSMYKKRIKHLDYWIIMLSSDLILAQLRGIMPALYRVSYYFAINKVESYPCICKIFNKKSSRLVTFGLIIALLIIWYYQIVIQGNEMVYPYSSDIFKWLN